MCDLQQCPQQPFFYLMHTSVHDPYTPRTHPTGQLRARPYTPFVLRWKNGQQPEQEDIHSELVSDATQTPAEAAQLWRQWRKSSERGVHRELRADADR